MKIIDNYFNDPDSIRDFALNQVFYSKETHPGDIAQFPGMRTDYINNLDLGLYNNLVESQVNALQTVIKKYNFTEYWTKFSFSYTLNNVGIGLHRDFTDNWNGFKKFYGGVIYLHPNPEKGCGTIVNSKTVENKYNRYVLYDATHLHGLEGSFGTTKYNSRLVLTHFMYFK